jgi:hypothetical protein
MCPVCGFDGLKEAPYDGHNAPSYEICPCCGFEFGFENKESFISFRKDWIAQGSLWFMPNAKPKNWDLHKQLDKLKKDPI